MSSQSQSRPTGVFWPAVHSFESALRRSSARGIGEWNCLIVTSIQRAARWSGQEERSRPQARKQVGTCGPGRPRRVRADKEMTTESHSTDNPERGARATQAEPNSERLSVPGLTEDAALALVKRP